MNKAQAKQKCALALKEITFDDLLRATKLYAQEQKNLGTDQTYIKHPTSFLTSKRYLDYTDPSYELPRQSSKASAVESSNITMQLPTITVCPVCKLPFDKGSGHCPDCGLHEKDHSAYKAGNRDLKGLGIHEDYWEFVK